MTSSLRVGVAGATGALGREVLAVLDQVPWRPARVVALARASTSTPTVEYGEEHLPVDDLADQAMEDLDALVLALPGDAALAAADRALDEGVVVVDGSGALAGRDEVRRVVPWINPEAITERDPGAAVSLPGPAAFLLASALGPLGRAGISGDVDATVLLPASVRGRDGIDELSRQVVALFNAASPPRKVFEEGLAFDLLPAVGAPGEDGRTSAERTAVDELRDLVGPGGSHDVTIVGVPVFSGVAAAVHLRADRPVPLELVARILADGGLVLPQAEGVRHLPRPRKVEGQPFAHVGRLRRDASGRGLHLWLAMDNLRATATAAVALVRKLTEDLA